MLFGSLAAASVAIYAAIYVAPGDPVAVLTGGRAISPEARQSVIDRYHLDEPFPVRYARWLWSGFHGDFGTSIVTRQDVSSMIAQKAPTTMLLIAMTTLVVLLVGIVSGVIGGLRPGPFDTLLVVATTVLAALPSFVAALVLIMLFAVDLRWLPALGDGIGFGDRVRHLILPSIALSTTSIAFVARITRVSVREESQREFVQTATARGLSRATVVRSHILRNAAIPIVTVSGVTIASLVALVAVVEEAFHLNGLGAALVSAAGSKDFAVVQAISLIMVGAFVLANTVVDFLYAMLDPRVTLGTAAA